MLQQPRTMANPSTLAEHENAAAILDQYEPGLVHAKYVFCAAMPTAGLVSDLAIDNFWQYGRKNSRDAYHNKITAIQTALQAGEIASEKYWEERLAIKQQELADMTAAACTALPDYGHTRMWELCTDNGTTPFDFDLVVTWTFDAENRPWQKWTFTPEASNTGP